MRRDYDDDEILAGLAALERPVFRESYGDYVDPRGPLVDDGEQWSPVGSGYAPGLSITEWAPYTTGSELRLVQQACRFLAHRSGIAAGIVDKLPDYVINDGLEYRAQAAKGQEPPPELLAEIQGLLAKFLDRHDFPSLERELLQREMRDGEWFLALYPQPDGSCALRVVEPEAVIEPSDKAAAENLCCELGWVPSDEPLNWSYGVLTPACDVEAAIGYWVEQNHGGRLLPTSRVEHRKVNMARNWKRGLPDLWPVRRTLWQAERVLNNTAEGVCVQAAIAGVRKHASTTSNSQISDLATSGKLDQQQTVQTGGGYSRTLNYSSIRPGAVLDIRGYDWDSGPLGSERAQWFLLAMNACCRIAGTRWSMPEYMVASDASNGNMASTFVAGDPFVKHCQRRQREHGAAVRNLLWKMLRLAYAAGRINAPSWEVVEQLVEITYTGQTIEVRDLGAETERNAALASAGLLSDATWAAREGLDLGEERKLGAKKAATAASQFGFQPFAASGGAPQPDRSRVMESLAEGLTAARAKIAETWAAYGADSAGGCR